MAVWFGNFFHFGVCYRPKHNSGKRMILFEHEADALREAKFALHNCVDNELTVYSLDKDTTAKPIWRSSKKVKLVKVKEE